MTSNTFIKIKRSAKPTPQPQEPFQAAAPGKVKPTQTLEIEQPEQPEIIAESEPVAEILPDESVFGCGWSVTELRNEFSGRQ